MADLGRHLSLVAVILAAVTSRGDGSAVSQQLSGLTENSCMPAGVGALTSLGCDSEPDLTHELSCIASSVAISTEAGYDAAAGDRYIDSLGGSDEWSTLQKRHLTNCSSYVLDQVPPEREGAFVLACWHELLLSRCHRDKMVAEVGSVDPERASELVEAVADMAEGPCFDSGLKYADDLGEKWTACVEENELDMDVLTGAAHYYTLFSRGEEVPEPSVENNNRIQDQLDTLVWTQQCYADVTGEVDQSLDIDYERIHKATREAEGEERFKVVDKAFVEFCRDQNPESIGKFYTCFNKQKPLACTVLKAYDVAMGRASSAATTMSVAPTAAGFLAGLLGSIF